MNDDNMYNSYGLLREDLKDQLEALSLMVLRKLSEIGIDESIPVKALRSRFEEVLSDIARDRDM